MHLHCYLQSVETKVSSKYVFFNSTPCKLLNPYLGKGRPIGHYGKQSSKSAQPWYNQISLQSREVEWDGCLEATAPLNIYNKITRIHSVCLF